jgi:uncharacterized membrane protein (UPF0127 family)
MCHRVNAKAVDGVENAVTRPLTRAVLLLGHNATMKHIFAALLLTAAALTSASAQEQPQTNLQRITLSAGIHQIDTQVALTPEQHAIGLMHRKEMPQQEGMLFVFPNPTKQCFWMKNTLLPLTAAFVADDGTIINLEDMKPQTTDSHCSAKPVRYVLEMNQGWFAKKGLKAGSKLGGRPFELR